MDIYEKIKKKYTTRRAVSITAMVAGSLSLVLTLIFIFIDLDGQVPNWNQFHFWAAGLGIVLITGGAVIFVASISALKDIEKTVNRLNPDEREQAIFAYAKSKTFKVYIAFVCPAVFVAASILLMLNIINFIAWIIFIANFMAIFITYAIVRKIAYRKF